MMKNTRSQFAKQYRAALRRHLQHPSHARSSLHSAQSLGRSAASRGLDTMELARVHGQVVAALAASSNARQNGKETFSRAGAFLVGSLAPLERKHRMAEAAAARTQNLDGLLRKRSVEVTALKRTLRQEVERRKVVEAQLAQGTQHYGQLLARSRRMEEQSRRLAHQVLLAQEEERREISRELHDEVAQILAGINVRLAALKEAATANSRTLQQRIAQTQRLVEQSVEVVHRFARELRPALLDDLGLIPALRSYIKDLPGRKDLRIRFSAFPAVEVLDNMRRTVLYRVAQEALTNVARHAHAQLATVRIHKLPGAVRLEVHDDGKSFAVDRMLASNRHKRLGLIGMQERVEMVGGTFAIDSAPGVGTTVRAVIPDHRKQQRSHR